MQNTFQIINKNITDKKITLNKIQSACLKHLFKMNTSFYKKLNVFNNADSSKTHSLLGWVGVHLFKNNRKAVRS